MKDPIILFAAILSIVFVADCVCGCIANYMRCKAQIRNVLWDAYPERKRR